MNNEAAIEKEIQEKGLNAPRLTPDMIDGLIMAEWYHRPQPADLIKWDETVGIAAADRPLRCLTICVLVLRNGFTVVGKSACASPENFDESLGRKIARDDARRQIWPLAGYALREQLSAKENQHAS